MSRGREKGCLLQEKWRKNLVGKKNKDSRYSSMSGTVNSDEWGEVSSLEVQSISRGKVQVSEPKLHQGGRGREPNPSRKLLQRELWTERRM